LNKKVNYFDTLLNKAISRKLIVFSLASAFLISGLLDEGNWTLLACIYIGTQGVIDFYKIKNQ